MQSSVYLNLARVGRSQQWLALFGPIKCLSLQPWIFLLLQVPDTQG